MKLAAAMIANVAIFTLATIYFGGWVLVPLIAAYLVGIFQAIEL